MVIFGLHDNAEASDIKASISEFFGEGGKYGDALCRYLMAICFAEWSG
jgi:hypothetical protein